MKAVLSMQFFWPSNPPAGQNSSGAEEDIHRLVEFGHKIRAHYLGLWWGLCWIHPFVHAFVIEMFSWHNSKCLPNMFEVGVFPRCTCLVICSDSVRDYVMTCVENCTTFNSTRGMMQTAIHCLIPDVFDLAKVVGSTHMNAHSSRSHVIVTLHLQQVACQHLACSNDCQM